MLRILFSICLIIALSLGTGWLFENVSAQKSDTTAHPKGKRASRKQAEKVVNDTALVKPGSISSSDLNRPVGSSATRPVPKAPLANKSASLIFFYYGDSKYTTLGQETVKLKKAMEGYDFKVLLKAETLPSWADLSEKDEKLANIKDLPTKANLFKYLKQLAADGYYIDLFIFSHGWKERFKALPGTKLSDCDGGDCVRASDITAELSASQTGFTVIPIRMVWGTNCYGQTLGETWRSVGAKTTAGARYVQFYPNAFGNFIDDWNKGNVSFESAVGTSDTNAVRTVTQTYISLVHAPSTNKQWGKCPFGSTVLGDKPCARDYFDEMWLSNGEWQANKSGKDNMNHSSFMFRGGDKHLTKNMPPVW